MRKRYEIAGDLCKPLSSTCHKGTPNFNRDRRGGGPSPRDDPKEPRHGSAEALCISMTVRSPAVHDINVCV
jgi:hypothetical protein